MEELCIDKIRVVIKRIILVRFKAMNLRDNVLDGHYFFDKKPMVLKPLDTRYEF